MIELPASLRDPRTLEARSIREALERARYGQARRRAIARLRAALRSYLDLHEAAATVVNDAGERNGHFWRLSRSDCRWRASPDLTPRSAAVLTEGLIALEADVPAWCLGIGIAMADGRIDWADSAARRAMGELGCEGSASHLIQWHGIARHLLGDQAGAIESLRRAAASSLGPVRRCSLVSLSFIADSAGAAGIVDWSLERLVEEDAGSVAHAFSIVVQTRKNRLGASALAEARERLRRRAERTNRCSALVGWALG